MFITFEHLLARHLSPFGPAWHIKCHGALPSSSLMENTQRLIILTKRFAAAVRGGRQISFMAGIM